MKLVSRSSLLCATIACISLVMTGCSAEQRAAKSLERGKQYAAANDYARALLEFKNAMQATPQNAEPYYQTAVIQLAVGNTRGGYEALIRATELNPKHAAAQAKLAEMFLGSSEKSDLQKAEQRAEAALTILPNDVGALNTLALVQWKLGKKEDAERHLEQAFAKSPQHVYSAVSLAKLRMEKRDIQGAEDLLKKAANQQPPVPDLIAALAEFYAATKRIAEAEQQYRRVLGIDPKNAAALLDLGALLVQQGRPAEAGEIYRRLTNGSDKKYRTVYVSFLLQAGRLDDAIGELNRLHQGARQDREIRTLLVQVYLQRGKAAEAEKLLSQALAENPDDTEAVFQRSLIDTKIGNDQRAWDGLTKVVSVMPDLAEAHYGLARLHLRRGNVNSSQQELGETLRLDPTHLAARVELSRVLIGRGALEGALNLMDRTPAAQRQSLMAVVQRNWALIALGRWDEANRAVEQSLKKAQVVELYLQQATIRLAKHDLTGARKASGTALEVKPDDVRALRLLARTYVEQHQFDAAIIAVRRYADANSGFPGIQEFAGEFFLAAGKREEARQMFTNAKRADKNFTPAAVSLARLDLGEGKNDAARAEILPVLTADSGHTKAHLLMGIIEERSRRFDAAITHYRNVLDREPENLTALNNLAYLLATQGKNPDEALHFAEKAKEIAPYAPDIDDTLGWVLYYKGQYTSSVRRLEASVSADPTALRRYHLAMAYAKAGESRKAAEALTVALQQDPTLPEAQQARKVIPAYN